MVRPKLNYAAIFSSSWVIHAVSRSSEHGQIRCGTSSMRDIKKGCFSTGGNLESRNVSITL